MERDGFQVEYLNDVEWNRFLLFLATHLSKEEEDIFVKQHKIARGEYGSMTLEQWRRTIEGQDLRSRANNEARAPTVASRGGSEAALVVLAKSSPSLD